MGWGEPVPQKAWAAVLVSDCIYDECGHAALASTLASTVSAALGNGASTPPRILVAYQNRRPEIERKFFCKELLDVGLHSEELSLASVPLSEKLRSCVHVMDVTSLEKSFAAGVGDGAD